MASQLASFQAKLLEGDMQTIGVAILTIIIVYYVFKTVISRPKGKLPPMVPGLPYFGHIVEFGSDPITLMKNAYNKHGEIFRIKMFGQPITVLTGPEGNELFFKAKEDEFSACQAYRFTVPLFGKNIVYDAHPDVLVEQRKFVSGALTAKRFKLYVPMIEKEAEEYFTKFWGDEGTKDLLEAFNEVTVLTSTRCLHGKEIRETFSVEFAKLYWEMDAGFSALGFFFPNLPLPAMIGRDRARKRVGQILEQIIKGRKENPEVEHEDVVQTLMESKYKDGRPVPEDHIIGLMVALLIAGQHTSNVTGTWTGVHLLQNKDKWAKAKEELDRVVGDEPMDFDKLKECTYLDACVKETLRLRPPIIIMMRRVVKDMEHKGYTIPEGTIVAASPVLTHRLPTVYENPDRFEPERFHEREEDRKTPYGFLAFGAGKHACIGEAFAYVQIKTLWAWLIRNYEIELVNQDVKPNFTTMVVSPQGPVNIRYKRIKK